MVFDLPATNNYVPLQNSRLFTYGIISSEGVSKLRFSFQKGAMKTQHFANIWKATLAPFAPRLITPLFRTRKFHFLKKKTFFQSGFFLNFRAQKVPSWNIRSFLNLRMGSSISRNIKNFSRVVFFRKKYMQFWELIPESGPGSPIYNYFFNLFFYRYIKSTYFQPGFTQ